MCATHAMRTLGKASVKLWPVSIWWWMCANQSAPIQQTLACAKWVGGWAVDGCLQVGGWAVDGWMFPANNSKTTNNSMTLSQQETTSKAELWILPV